MGRVAQAAALSCLLVGAARADGGDTAQAEAHFQAGYRAYHAGDFAGAVREFEAASKIHPSPILDYDMGAAFEKMGRPADAARYLRRYLEAAPQAPNRAEVEKRIAALTAPPPPPPPPTPPTPREPECPEGKLVADGHCCWPGQVYVDAESRCAGEPQCPPPLEPFDGTCRAHPKPPPPPPPRARIEPPAPLPAPFLPDQVRVGFVPRKEAASYEIRIGPRHCKATPCVLALPPGKNHVVVGGSGSFEQDLYVPARDVKVQVEHISRRAQIAGAILLPTGLLGTVVALAAMVANGGGTGTVVALSFIPFTAGIMTTGAILLGKSGSNALTVVGGLDRRGATAGISVTF